MPGAIRVSAAGGPDVLEWADVEVGQPGPGEVRVKHGAIGVNFIDIYYRTGVYPPPGGFPFIPGTEAAGVVEAVGPEVTAFRPGDRVVYQGGMGAYAEERNVAADKLIRLPDDVADRIAAGVFMKGLTVQCLLRRTFKVEKGMTVLWHAAAGGVGSIATQWASALGASVIGTVGSDEKAAHAKANGCDHVINYRTEDFVARVKEITKGAGVDVVYDSVGKDTFPGSLDCLRPMGMFVSFGQSSGLPPPVPMSMLQQKGSLFATRPTVFHYLAKRSDLEASAAELFAALRSGTVRIAVDLAFPLREAAEAHSIVESRKSTGPVVLLP